MITAKQFLAAAWSYFNNKESLIYSWAGQTFLSGSPLFDAEHANKGNIDCSTYVHLALMGIPYESSPYATGDAQLLFPLADPASDQPLIDGLQESMHMNLYHGIDFNVLTKEHGSAREFAATRYLKKHLEEPTPQRIREVLERQSARKAFGIAHHLAKRGFTFTDPSQLRSGDLAFFRSMTRKPPRFEKFGIYMGITHVGIVCEDTAYMLHATGTRNKENDLAKGFPIQYSPVFDQRVPCLFAHCTAEE